MRPGLRAALPVRDTAAAGPGSRIHIFGFASDIERTDVLYTSLLLQMWHGLDGAEVAGWSRSPRAWRRSWLLGFASAVVSRVRAAEHAAASARPPRPGGRRVSGPRWCSPTGRR